MDSPMAHAFHLRRVTPDDAAIGDAIEHAVFPPSEAATRQQIDMRIRLFPEGLFVAEADDEVVGFINTGNAARPLRRAGGFGYTGSRSFTYTEESLQW
jgi:hypothetical protein